MRGEEEETEVDEVAARVTAVGRPVKTMAAEAGEAAEVGTADVNKCDASSWRLIRFSVFICAVKWANFLAMEYLQLTRIEMVRLLKK